MNVFPMPFLVFNRAVIGSFAYTRVEEEEEKVGCDKEFLLLLLWLLLFLSFSFSFSYGFSSLIFIFSEGVACMIYLPVLPSRT